MRILLAVALTFGLTFAPVAETKSGTMYRIGVIFFGSPETASLGAFGHRLAELGYIEGQNIVFELRYARGKQEVLPSLAAELVRLRVDAIYTTGDQLISAAKQATTTIPIVMVACDALAAGLIASLARPGGNNHGNYVPFIGDQR